MKIQKKGFTLIEILVAITIFSIMLISVMGVYLTSSKVTSRADLNRSLQENVKNIFVNLSEDIMKNGASGVSKAILSDCSLETKKTNKGDKLCISENKYYFLGTKDTTNGEYIRKDNDFCSGKDAENNRNHCFLLQSNNNTITPITNDLVTIENLNFLITQSNEYSPKKVTVSFKLTVAPKSGLSEELVKITRFSSQFTISERKYSK